MCKYVGVTPFVVTNMSKCMSPSCVPLPWCDLLPCTLCSHLPQAWDPHRVGVCQKAFFLFSVLIGWKEIWFCEIFRLSWTLTFNLLSCCHFLPYVRARTPPFKECRPLLHFPCHHVLFEMIIFSSHTRTHTIIDLQTLSELHPQPPAIISTLSHPSVLVQKSSSFRIHPPSKPSAIQKMAVWIEPWHF